MNQLRRIDFWRSYIRSFLIQAGWNCQRMMALGFTWTILPLTERLYSTFEDRGSFLKRHLGFFNSNPYLANYAVGAVASLEREGVCAEEIIGFKESLIGPLGALGDSLIWVRLRPALAVLGIILALQYGILGSVTFLLLYNIFQLWLRYVSLKKGFTLGFGLTGHLSRKIYPRLIRILSMSGAILFGFFFIFLLSDFASFEKIGALLFFLSVFFFCTWALRRNLNPGLVFLVSLFGGVGLNLLFRVIVIK